MLFGSIKGDCSLSVLLCGDVSQAVDHGVLRKAEHRDDCAAAPLQRVISRKSFLSRLSDVGRCSAHNSPCQRTEFCSVAFLCAVINRFFSSEKEFDCATVQLTKKNIEVSFNIYIKIESCL